MHEEHEDYVGKLKWSSRREKGQYRSNDAREEDVGKLTLSSRYGMGKHRRPGVGRMETGRKEGKITFIFHKKQSNFQKQIEPTDIPRYDFDDYPHTFSVCG